MVRPLDTAASYHFLEACDKVKSGGENQLAKLLNFPAGYGYSLVYLHCAAT